MGEDSIEHFLLQLGMSPKLYGFEAVCAGVRLLHEHQEYGQMVTKALYPAIAKQVDSTPVRVERTIRTAIKRVLDTCDGDTCRKMLGMYPDKRSGTYTVSEFLILCAMRVRVK